MRWSTSTHSHVRTLAVVAQYVSAVLLINSCSDASSAPVTRTDGKTPLAAAAAWYPNKGVSINTQLPAPINDTITTNVPAFTMVNLGNGGAGSFTINKPTSAAIALQAATNGTGP